MNKSILTAILGLIYTFVFSQASAPIYSVCTLPSVINESSGIEKTGPNTFWSHNDSGGQPAIYKFDSSGTLLKTLTITNALNIDWEDIAEDQVLKTIYIGDFGNNSNNRSVANGIGLKIYKISDPNLIAGNTTTAGVINFEYVDRNFSAPAGNHNFDMEGFFFFNDSLHLFTKNRTNPTNGLIKHYILPSTPGTYTAMVVDSFNNGGAWITSADISANKKTVALSGINKIWLFSCFKGSKFISTGTNTVLTMPLTLKEAIVFSGDSSVYVTDENTGSGTGRLYRANLAAALTPSIVLTITTSASLLCAGQTATINASGANTYTWSNSVIAQSIAISPTITTNYSVTATATTGCTNSSSITQNVLLCTDIASLKADEIINLFPNPFSDKFTLTVNSSDLYFIRMYNSSGLLIYSTEIKQGQLVIDLKGQPTGIYFIYLKGNNGLITKKLIKE